MILTLVTCSLYYRLLSVTFFLVKIDLWPKYSLLEENLGSIESYLVLSTEDEGYYEQVCLVVGWFVWSLGRLVGWMI